MSGSWPISVHIISASVMSATCPLTYKAGTGDLAGRNDLAEPLCRRYVVSLSRAQSLAAITHISLSLVTASVTWMFALSTRKTSRWFETTNVEGSCTRISISFCIACCQPGEVLSRQLVPLPPIDEHSREVSVIYINGERRLKTHGNRSNGGFKRPSLFQPV